MRLKPLDRKLLRDLWGMKGQALAIALVITSGVATFIMSLSTLDSLTETRDAYYRRYLFADVFASLKRAPQSVAERIEAIEGVKRVRPRVVAPVNVEIEGFTDPIVGEIYSIPERGEPDLNGLYMASGRLPAPDGGREVVVSDAFAGAQGLGPGDELSVVIRGKRERLSIVGVALSPEHIYQIGPGAIFPDFKRYAVMWMRRDAVASGYEMEGAFNNVVLTLEEGAVRDAVIDRLDLILEPYGGLGAYGREDQLSNHFLREDLRQLSTIATLFPFIFLGVAGFLLNVVIGRLVSTQRDQIAILKAFGYTNRDVGVHYLKMVLMVVALGLVGGVAAGAWMGNGLSHVYQGFYRFPFLYYVLRPHVAITASMVATAAVVAGTAFALRRAALLPPAEAMRPEPMPVYRETLMERAGLKRFLSQPTRMIGRHIERRPVKSLLTITGVSLACAVMMVGSFQEDAINFMVDVQFGMSEREDLTVVFTDPTSRSALHELTSMEGVISVEAFRRVPARLRFEHREYRTSIRGKEPGGELVRLLNTDLEPVEIPSGGMVLTEHLGDILGVEPGDTITVEVLEGSRPVREVQVAALVKQYMGISGYMTRHDLNRFMREGDAISGAYLDVDSRYKDSVYAELKGMPRVAGTVIRKAAIASFYETLEETILYFTFISTLLGGTIAFGVIYNIAWIAFSERGRELASLRVLGFTRGEISYILLGEMAVLTLAAIPVGFLVGRALCMYLVLNLESDLYRVPLVLEKDTYAFAAAVVVASAVASGAVIRRKLDRLDLVSVLKTRE